MYNQRKSSKGICKLPLIDRQTILVGSISSTNDGSETNTNSEFYNLVHQIMAPPQFTAHRYVHIVRLF